MVVDALVTLRGASKPELIEKSGVGNAPRALKAICAKYSLLQPFISLPGKRGAGGYSTTIRAV
jgi:hypothetical protein